MLHLLSTDSIITFGNYNAKQKQSCTFFIRSKNDAIELPIIMNNPNEIGRRKYKCGRTIVCDQQCCLSLGHI